MGIFSDIGNFFQHDIIDPVDHFVQNDIVDPIANLFKPPAPDPTLAAAITAQTAAFTSSSAAATAATQAATKAQQDAQLQAEAAATPPTDSESSRSASDDLLRKTLAGGVYGIGMPATTGAAPVGYRLLSGSP